MRGRAWFGLAAAVLAGIGMLVAFTGGEQARLAAIEPGDGVAVTGAPSEVALRFTGVPAPRAVHLVVAGPDGAGVVRDTPVVLGNRIVVAVDATLAGRYQVAYHVELAGADVSGVSTFTVGPGGGAPAAAPAGHTHLQRDPVTAVLVLLDLVLVTVLTVLLIRRPRVR